MSGLGGLLELNDDVVITPVLDLPEELRREAECTDNDFAVSRVRGRGGSSIIDAESAQLLNRFREPLTIVDAVILFARAKGADVSEVLDGAYPFLRGMVQRQVLISPEDRAAERNVSAIEWDAGTELPFGVITRVLQRLDEGEVFQIRRTNGSLAVLKAHRARVSNGSPSHGARVTSPLAHEARVLQALEGEAVPGFIATGEHGGREFLMTEFVSGIDAASAMQESRELSARDYRAAALRLVRAVATAYARLHACGVLHGDVHPRNVLVLRDGSVRLIDFGLASGTTADSSFRQLSERGGVPFFFDPDLAAASLAGRTPPLASVASEQFSVAAMLFSLITGEHWRRFRLGRQEMLQDLTSGTPRRFAECGVDSWPVMEEVLSRALSLDANSRYESMSDFLSALPAVSDAVDTRTAPPTTASTNTQFALLQALSADGTLFNSVLPAPRTSVNYGAAGVALGALHAAKVYSSPELLATADAWVARSLRDMQDEESFYNNEIEISRTIVGEASPYHTQSGVHAVDALVARASGNLSRFEHAVGRFIEGAEKRASGLDITLGRSSTLLGAAILHDAAPADSESAMDALRTFGDANMHAIWQQLDRMQPVGGSDLEYVGMAHGWAGFLYATLQWCDVTGAPIPTGATRRLDEVGALALPFGRGLQWPWVLGTPGEAPTMPGWCNGSCGYVFLYTLAHRLLGSSHYESLAVGAAWNSWEAGDTASTLCCGLAGRAYALLNLYRHTSDAAWLDRARRLSVRAEKGSGQHKEYPHSLYKGGFGVTILAADIEDADWARMPLFEPYGYRKS